MAHNKETLRDLVDDSIVATPMPQASSTVDKRIKYKSLLNVQEQQLTEENAIQQGIAAIEEMKKKLSILNYMPSDSVWNNSNNLSNIFPTNSSIGFHKQLLHGEPMMSLDDQSLKKDTLMEESGFTKLQNISDLERDELYCCDSWGYIPSDKINMSLTAVENSKIVPPDFMPAEDSLFTELQSYKCKNETKIIRKPPLNKDIKEESAEDTTLIKYDDLTEVNREIPSISDIALALKKCKEDANPRKIMDQVLKAGEKKTSIIDISEIEKKKIDVKAAVGQNSSAVNGQKPITIEEYLIWGNVEIGQWNKKVLHIIHEQEQEEVYKFSIEGNNAFKILVNWPSDSTPTRYAFSNVKHSSSYELHVLFQPNVVGQSTGFLTIESESYKTVKKVHLSGFGGKGRLILSDIIFDFSSCKEYLILSRGLKKTFKLENCGTSTSFFYFSQELLEDYYDIQPKQGLIKANEVVSITISLILSKAFISNIFSLHNEKYLDIGKLTIHFGDDSTRLRVYNLFHKYKEESSIKLISMNCPFLKCSSFPSSEVDVSLLNDEKSCITDLIHDGISKIEIGIKAERSAILGSLDFDRSYFQLLSSNQLLVVKKAGNINNTNLKV